MTGFAFMASSMVLVPAILGRRRNHDAGFGEGPESLGKILQNDPE
jgi:hypothetical protein